MNPSIIQELGNRLYEALATRTVIAPLTDQYPDMTIEDAYQVQQLMLSKRLAAGEQIVGKKVGVTRSEERRVGKECRL